MTPFSLLSRLALLTAPEVAELCGVSLDTAKSWSSGRRRAPAWAEALVGSVVLAQERAAAAVRLGSDPPVLERPADVAAAQAAGFRSLAAWDGYAARVWLRWLAKREGGL